MRNTRGATYVGFLASKEALSPLRNTCCCWRLLARVLVLSEKRHKDPQTNHRLLAQEVGGPCILGNAKSAFRTNAREQKQNRQVSFKSIPGLVHCDKLKAKLIFRKKNNKTTYFYLGICNFYFLK